VNVPVKDRDQIVAAVKAERAQDDGCSPSERSIGEDDTEEFVLTKDFHTAPGGEEDGEEDDGEEHEEGRHRK